MNFISQKFHVIHQFLKNIVYRLTFIIPKNIYEPQKLCIILLYVCLTVSLSQSGVADCQAKVLICFFNNYSVYNGLLKSRFVQRKVQCS